jgi:hypothetical protein
MMMRVCAPFFLRVLGFRNVLTWVGLLATLILALTAAFRPSWPLPVIYIVLVANGFFQSLQFMAYNTIAYADVPRPEMSAATSFYTTFQQMSLTLGIAISAAALAASVGLTRHPGPELPDFSAAFLFVSVVSLFAPLLAMRLEKGAGAELSGHRDRAPAYPGGVRDARYPVPAPGPIHDGGASRGQPVPDAATDSDPAPAIPRAQSRTDR